MLALGHAIWNAAGGIFIARVHDHLLRHFQLESSRARMGGHASGWATKAVMTLLVLAALYLTWQNARVLLAAGP